MAHNEATIMIRPISRSDETFLRQMALRLVPGSTASPRDPIEFREYFEQLTPASLTSVPGSMAFVGGLNGVALGLISAHLDVDFFTNHSRLYVDTLAVAEEAEGRGVGRVLMTFIETQAGELGCREVVLDVFANNERARKFYE